jgi:hypothetical protein
MQYVLGNMLNGGGINPDGLSLDLQFAADKTFSKPSSLAAGETAITSRRGPSATFLRSSGATEVGPDGLIRYAPENLMLNSGNVSLMDRLNVPVATGQTGGPLGSYYTLGVDATSDFHIYRNSGVTPAASASSMMWVLAKRGTARYLRIGGGAASTFDWDTLTFSSISTSHSAGDAVAVGDGWYWLPILRAQTSFIDVAPSSSSGVSFSYNETANITVEVAAIQVSRSILLQNTAPDYIPTTTAAVYGPRFDHDPVTLACKGLLIEEGRTNLQTNSQTFASWSTTDLTVAASVINDPMGQLARILTEGSAAASSHRVFQDITATSGTTYSTSYYVKAGTRTWCGIVGQGAAFPAAAYFNLATGALGSGSGAGYVNHLIQPLLNGWYRVTLVATAQATGAASLSLRLTTGDNTPTHNGDGVSFLYASMAQTEAGSFPTSYIPTTTGSVVRSADVCNITGGDFTGMYNGTEGTVLISASLPNLGGNNRGLWGINNNTNLHGFLTYYDLTASGIISQSRNAGNTALTGNFTNSAGVLFKRALAYYFGGCSLSTNGSAVTNTSVTISTQTMLTMQIGNMLAGSFQGTCHIAALRYYKKRLPDAKLVTLTV